jgi:hypothetical protein
VPKARWVQRCLSGCAVDGVVSKRNRREEMVSDLKIGSATLRTCRHITIGRSHSESIQRCYQVALWRDWAIVLCQSKMVDGGLLV